MKKHKKAQDQHIDLITEKVPQHIHNTCCLPVYTYMLTMVNCFNNEKVFTETPGQK